MKPKVLIDSISLVSPLTGIGRYTYEIAQEFKRCDKYDIDYFYGFCSKKLLEPMKNQNSLSSIISKNPLVKKIARKMINLFSRIFAPSYDLYWQPNFIPNMGIRSKKIVTTVHDFSFIIYSDFHPCERVEYYKENFFKNISKSDIIITGSNFTKNEIVTRLNISKERVRVIYHGVNHNIFKLYDDVELNFDLPDKFILCVGSIEPRKNLLGLIKAYNLLSSDIKSSYKLVLVGFKGWENREFLKIMKENKSNIIYLGFICDEDLAKVYNRAALFMFVSFYEGFGMPPLESYACGTPVIASDRSSIPEICGDGAIYCDSNSSKDIKQKMELVLSDRVLQKQMIEKGLKISKKFSWKKSAQDHLTVFEEVLGK